MGDRLPGVLLASVQMALGGQGPMTPKEIAAYLTRLNPHRPFSSSQIIAVLRSRPDLFAIESRRFLGLGPPRWRLEAAPASHEPNVAQPPRPPMATTAAPQPNTTPKQPGINLIEDEAPTSASSGVSFAELEALKKEVRRRRAKRGRISFGTSRVNYRSVIDPDHPISRLNDQTLERLASEVRPYIDSD